MQIAIKKACQKEEPEDKAKKLKLSQKAAKNTELLPCDLAAFFAENERI
jgi:hypothetical protein